MTWEKWVLVVWLAFGAVIAISKIGQPRKPVEPGDAVLALVLNGAAAVLVVFA